jgi:thymidine kinase
MVVEGAQVVVGDVNAVNEIGYEVLCRRHHRRRTTAATAHAAALSPDVLPVLPQDRAAAAGEPRVSGLSVRS